MSEAVWYAGIQLRRSGRAVTVEAIQEVLYARTGVFYDRMLILEGIAGLVFQDVACVAVVFAEEDEQ